MPTPHMASAATMEGMPSPVQLWVLAKRRLLVGLSLILLFSLAACKHGEQQTNSQALDEAGMWSNSVSELRILNVSNAEIGEPTKARQGGLSHPALLHPDYAVPRSQSQAASPALICWRRGPPS